MNVSPGQLARVVAPFPMRGRGAFVVVRRPYRGEPSVAGCTYAIDPRITAWICSGWVRFDGIAEALGPFVVIADDYLVPCVGLHLPDSRDLTVSQHRRTT